MDAIEDLKVPHCGSGEETIRGRRSGPVARYGQGYPPSDSQLQPPLAPNNAMNVTHGMSFDIWTEGSVFSSLSADLLVPPLSRADYGHNQDDQAAMGRFGGCAPHRARARYQPTQQQQPQRTNFTFLRWTCYLLATALVALSRSTMILTALCDPRRATLPTTDVAGVRGADAEKNVEKLQLSTDPRKFLAEISSAALNGGKSISPQVVYNGANSPARAPLGDPADRFVDRYLLNGEGGTHFPMEFGIAVGLPANVYLRYKCSFGRNYTKGCITVPLTPSSEVARVGSMIFYDQPDRFHRLMMGHEDSGADEGVLPYTETSDEGAPPRRSIRDLSDLPDPADLVVPDEPGRAPKMPAYLATTGEFGKTLVRLYDQAPVDADRRKNISGADADVLAAELAEGRSVANLMKLTSESGIELDQDTYDDVMYVHGTGDKTDLDAVYAADEDESKYVVELAKPLVRVMLKHYAATVVPAEVEYEEVLASYRDRLNQIALQVETIRTTVEVMQGYEDETQAVIDYYKAQKGKSGYTVYQNDTLRGTQLLVKAMQAQNHLARWNQRFIDYLGTKDASYAGYESGMQPLDISSFPPLAQIAIISLVDEMVVIEQLTLPRIPEDGPIFTAVQMALRKLVKAEKRGPLAVVLGFHAYPMYLLTAITSALSQNAAEINEEALRGKVNARPSVVENLPDLQELTGQLTMYQNDCNAHGINMNCRELLQKVMNDPLEGYRTWSGFSPKFMNYLNEITNLLYTHTGAARDVFTDAVLEEFITRICEEGHTLFVLASRAAQDASHVEPGGKVMAVRSGNDASGAKQGTMGNTRGGGAGATPRSDTKKHDTDVRRPSDYHTRKMADLEEYPPPDKDASRPGTICTRVLRDAATTDEGTLVPCTAAASGRGCHFGLHPFGVHDTCLDAYPKAMDELKNHLKTAKHGYKLNKSVATAFDLVHDDLSDAMKRSNANFPNDGNPRTQPSNDLPRGGSGGGGSGGGGGGGGSGGGATPSKSRDKPKMNRAVMLATVKGTVESDVFAAITALPEDEQYDQCLAVMQQSWSDTQS